jgi:NADH dehydrogenase FAD-containing subunit
MSEINIVLIGAGHTHILILEKIVEFAKLNKKINLILISNSEFAYYSGMIPVN